MSGAKKSRATIDPQTQYRGNRRQAFERRVKGLFAIYPYYPDRNPAETKSGVCPFNLWRSEMSDSDSRHIARESMFLMADLRVDGQEDEHRVKVRNLSNGGLMAEGAVRIGNGTDVRLNLRNIGWVDGVVAWVQDNRFGVAFKGEVDAKLARLPVSNGEQPELPRYVRPVLLDPKSVLKAPIRKV